MTDEVFVYTWGEGVPKDVVRVWIDSSVLWIPKQAFHERYKLEVVEFRDHDSLRGIGNDAFARCITLREANVSDGVTSIGDAAFFGATSQNSDVRHLLPESLPLC